MNIEKQYLDALQGIISNGIKKPNRTGVDTLVNPSPIFLQHDMSEGFPLMTHRFIPYKSVRVELEGFIKGVTSKKWYMERGCRYWSQFCNPQKVPYGHDEETKKKMAAEDDLGPIYGYQFRKFNEPCDGDNASNKSDQLKTLVQKLKNDPNDRRGVVSAWNPLQMDQMALPPCHVMFMVNIVGGRLNLSWSQRSCDMVLGNPSNIASYATLLHLLAKELKVEEGYLSAIFHDAHIYENHLDGITECLMNKETYPLPQIETLVFQDIFNWEHTYTELSGYNYLRKLKFDIAV